MKSYRHFQGGYKSINANGEKVEQKRCEKWGKVCFSKVEAQTFVNSKYGGKKRLTAYYFCEDCGFFHVTSRSKKTFGKRRKR